MKLKELLTANPSKSFAFTDHEAGQLLLEIGRLECLTKHAALTEFGSWHITYSAHSTHWILGSLFKGCEEKEEDGLSVTCLPKQLVSESDANRFAADAVVRAGGSRLEAPRFGISMGGLN